MQVKRPTAAAVLFSLIAVALVGCSAAEPGEDGWVATDPYVESAEAPPVEEEPVQAEALPRQSYSMTKSDDAGFQQTVVVTMGPAVLGSNADLMANEWASVGGTGPSPCVDINPGNDRTTNYVIETEFAGYAFGTLTITNDVPDFAPKDWVYQFIRGISNATPSAMGIGYSNGVICDGLSSGGLMVGPDWGDGTDPDWGPVPIVVAIADVRSPAFPDGDPSVVNAWPLNIYLTDMAVPLNIHVP